MSASRVTERIEPKLKMKWDEVLTSFAGGTLGILLDCVRASSDIGTEMFFYVQTFLFMRC